MSQGDRGLCGFGFLEHRTATLVIGLPQLRDCEVAGVADDQAHTEALFELGDASAQIGLGNAQGAGGLRETAMIHHHDEVLKVIEIQHGRNPFSQKALTIQGGSSLVWETPVRFCDYRDGSAGF
ncbi:hypothetical protein D3C81_1834170 [compost metagenome]